MRELHRKTKKTFNTPGHAHYLTFSCVERKPLLLDDRVCHWVTDAVHSARKTHNMAL